MRYNTYGTIDTFNTVIIKDITDKQEVLEVLANNFENEDFNGNNGEEFTRNPEAIEQGMSDQEYTISVLENSGLEGEEIIKRYLEELYGSDGYYTDYDYNLTPVSGNTYALSVVALRED